MDIPIKNLAWKILGWNLRGTNAESKQLALREKMVESGCAIACVQETKNLLIPSLSRKFALGALITLLLLHLLVHLGEFLLCGNLAFLKEG
jgi:hypothetical protein